jgi:outer membrane lipopolysaccharide assembly protein LptE/RlpB
VRVLLLALAGLTGCGYHIAGKADLLPKDIKTIAIPAFSNATARYKLADRLSSSMTREFLSRTRYQIVADPRDADATLTGALVNYTSFPIVVEEGRTTGVQVIVMTQITLTGRDGKVIFTRPGYEFRERYEVSVDQRSYFDESEVALDRLARDVARSLVSVVLEAF